MNPGILLRRGRLEDAKALLHQALQVECSKARPSALKGCLSFLNLLMRCFHVWVFVSKFHQVSILQKGYLHLLSFLR